MDIDTAWARHKLAKQAEGMTKPALDLMDLSRSYLVTFLGGIPEVSEVMADDLRRFILAFGQCSMSLCPIASTQTAAGLWLVTSQLTSHGARFPVW